MESSRGILAVCDNGHEMRVYTPDMGAKEAQRLAGLIDGRSPLYRYAPRTPAPDVTDILLCGLCRAWMTCTLFGYEHSAAGGDDVP